MKLLYVGLHEAFRHLQRFCEVPSQSVLHKVPIRWALQSIHSQGPSQASMQRGLQKDPRCFEGLHKVPMQKGFMKSLGPHMEGALYRYIHTYAHFRPLSYRYWGLTRQ